MKTLITTLALSALAVTALAHDGMHGPGSEYDHNDDGAISVEEYKVFLKEMKQDASKAAALFAAADSNKDGEVSSAEFVRAKAKLTK